MSDAEFANLYIEKIVNEVVELTKLRLMAETRISYLEKQVIDLQAQLDAVYNSKEQMEIEKPNVDEPVMKKSRVKV